MTEYFSHDYSARNDVKLKKLLMQHGVAGIGAYWCIVEMLYEAGGHLANEASSIISFDLRTDESLVNSVIDDFGLFIRQDGFFASPSVLRRIGERAEKSEKARQSVAARWANRENNLRKSQSVLHDKGGRNTSRNTNVSDAKYDDSEVVLLKSKVNKSKVKESKEYIYCAFFEKLWSDYPNKKGKSAVTTKALKELSEAGEPKVRAALQEYTDTKPDWQDWMYGSTFFNGRWKDYAGEDADTLSKASSVGQGEESDGEEWESY